MSGKPISSDVIEQMGGEACPIAILTGSGISAESGLSTFRGSGGLWAGHRVEDVATPEAFAREPGMVYDFYNTRRRHLRSEDVAPNAAHFALARLEASWPAPVTIITQNVDNLHERAGSSGVIHMHGELLKIRHVGTDEVREWHDDCHASTLGGGWRPHIVWFGEAVLKGEAIVEALRSAGLFLCVGTAGQVYPAAGFVREVAGPGVEFNLSRTEISDFFRERWTGPASETVPEFVDALLNV
jgi:NAD-dependent deacetylase